uniref:Uncharacterized protein n=1 Tax=Palpitomonas bilix TaxID=652834 RepID=A0A7S3G5E0_9EUKA|mmetsp:Transcript_20348/g.52103  ORF Transcript_20348/g.52103 Transcript_20348/m.52103 type:complete len:646 (+) Transcript_20348:294-2231(+)
MMMAGKTTMVLAIAMLLVVAQPAMGQQDTIDNILNEANRYINMARDGIAMLGGMIINNFPRFDFSFRQAVTTPDFVLNYTSDFNALISKFTDFGVCFGSIGQTQSIECSYAQGLGLIIVTTILIWIINLFVALFFCICRGCCGKCGGCGGSKPNAKGYSKCGKLVLVVFYFIFTLLMFAFSIIGILAIINAYSLRSSVYVLSASLAEGFKSSLGRLPEAIGQSELIVGDFIGRVNTLASNKTEIETNLLGMNATAVDLGVAADATVDTTCYNCTGIGTMTVEAANQVASISAPTLSPSDVNITSAIDSALGPINGIITGVGSALVGFNQTIVDNTKYVDLFGLIGVAVYAGMLGVIALCVIFSFFALLCRKSGLWWCSFAFTYIIIMILWILLVVFTVVVFPLGDVCKILPTTTSDLSPFADLMPGMGSMVTGLGDCMLENTTGTSFFTAFNLSLGQQIDSAIAGTPAGSINLTQVQTSLENDLPSFGTMMANLGTTDLGYNVAAIDTRLAEVNSLTTPDSFTRSNIASLVPGSYAASARLTTLKSELIGLVRDFRPRCPSCCAFSLPISAQCLSPSSLPSCYSLFSFSPLCSSFFLSSFSLDVCECDLIQLHPSHLPFPAFSRRLRTKTWSLLLSPAFAPMRML